MLHIRTLYNVRLRCDALLRSQSVRVTTAVKFLILKMYKYIFFLLKMIFFTKLITNYIMLYLRYNIFSVMLTPTFILKIILMITLE